MSERPRNRFAPVRAVSARVASHPHLAVLALVGLTALLTALGLRQVGHRRELMRLGYELSAATAELRRLDEESRRLRLEKSVLTGPARIEELAAHLGLVHPAPEQIRVVWRAPAALASPARGAAGAEAPAPARQP